MGGIFSRVAKKQVRRAVKQWGGGCLHKTKVGSERKMTAMTA